MLIYIIPTIGKIRIRHVEKTVILREKERYVEAVRTRKGEDSIDLVLRQSEDTQKKELPQLSCITE